MVAFQKLEKSYPTAVDSMLDETLLVVAAAAQIQCHDNFRCQEGHRQNQSGPIQSTMSIKSPTLDSMVTNEDPGPSSGLRVHK